MQDCLELKIQIIRLFKGVCSRETSNCQVKLSMLIYSIHISYFVNKPRTFSFENLAFLSLFLSGSI